MSKATLYILCGLPFAGKTTLAKELVKRFGFLRVDIDEIKHELGFGNKNDDELLQSEWNNIYQEAYKRVKNNLAAGKTVINDTGNFTRHERDVLRKIADTLGIRSMVIYLDIPVTVVKKRWLENKKTKERFDISEQSLDITTQELQLPTADEHVIYYDQTIPLGEWVKNHFS